MAQLVKSLRCEQEDLSQIPEQVKNRRRTGRGSAGVTEAGGSWGALASQPSQSVRVRPVREQGGWQPRNYT